MRRWILFRFWEQMLKLPSNLQPLL